MDEDKIFFIIVWCSEGAIALLLHGCGLYLLVTHKKKSVSDYLLIHLSCVEVTFFVLDITYHTRAVILINR